MDLNHLGRGLTFAACSRICRVSQMLWRAASRNRRARPRRASIVERVRVLAGAGHNRVKIARVIEDRRRRRKVFASDTDRAASIAAVHQSATMFSDATPEVGAAPTSPMIARFSCYWFCPRRMATRHTTTPTRPPRRPQTPPRDRRPVRFAGVSGPKDTASRPCRRKAASGPSGAAAGPSVRCADC